MDIFLQNLEKNQKKNYPEHFKFSVVLLLRVLDIKIFMSLIKKVSLFSF